MNSWAAAIDVDNLTGRWVTSPTDERRCGQKGKSKVISEETGL